MSGQDALFPALLGGLADFHARVTGSAGSHRMRLVRIAGQDSAVVTVAATTLEVVAEILAWLHEAIGRIDTVVEQIDGSLAMLAVAGQGLRGLGEALHGHDWPAGAPRPDAVADALVALGQVLAGIDVTTLPALIPEPATLAAIRTETRALLGERVDPGADPPLGALDRLIQELQQGSA